MASQRDGEEAIGGRLALLADWARETAKAASEHLREHGPRYAERVAERGRAVADRGRRHLDALVAGPVIPKAHEFGADWKTDSYMALCMMRAARAVQTSGFQPVTDGLVGLQIAAHAWPGGWRLWEVGLNARKVVEGRELVRLAASPMVHASLPLLASSAAALLEDGGEIERRLGNLPASGVMAAVAALQQGLYIASTWLANWLFPGSSLAALYRSDHLAGMYGTLAGIKVVASYFRQASAQHAGLEVGEGNAFALSQGHLSCWLHLGVSTSLLGGSLPSALCGVVAGQAVLHALPAVRRLWHRVLRGPRVYQQPLSYERLLNWEDALVQLFYGGLTLALVTYLRREQPAGIIRVG